MNTPMQLAMPAWLAGRARIQDEIRGRARANLSALTSAAADESAGLTLLRADAGWSAVLRLAGCGGERECAVRLVRERGVVVHPGSFYGMGEANRVIVSLIGPEEEFKEATNRMVR
jgi:aspartate/methionine/tyrosine aminotransferase